MNIGDFPRIHLGIIIPRNLSNKLWIFHLPILSLLFWLWHLGASSPKISSPEILLVCVLFQTMAETSRKSLTRAPTRQTIGLSNHGQQLLLNIFFWILPLKVRSWRLNWRMHGPFFTKLWMEILLWQVITQNWRVSWQPWVIRWKTFRLRWVMLRWVIRWNTLDKIKILFNYFVFWF